MRELTQKEKNTICGNIKEKSISNEIQNILNRIKVPEKTTKEDLKTIKHNIKNLLSEERPRKLTVKELDKIVSVIPYPPCPVRKISEYIREKIKQKIKSQLSKQKYLVKDKTIEIIRKILYESYLRSLVPSGSSVGSTGGMAVAGQITQAMLDAIHTDNSKTDKEESYKMIKRLIEIGLEPNVLKFTVHFNDKNLVSAEINSMGDMLKGITVQDFVLNQEILNEIPRDDWRHYKNHQLINGDEESIDPSEIENKFLRLTIDINKCLMYKTSLVDLCDVILNNTEDEDFDTTVICVSSPLDRGFIDIHGNADYIEYSVVTFSSVGKKMGNCSGNKKVKEDEELNKTKIGINEMKINEMTGIFLKVILGDCLCEMKVKGIPGVTSVYPAETIMMDSTFNQNKVYSDVAIEKYSTEPYNLEIDQIMRLWNIKVTKSSIYYEGITFDKIRESFEACGMDIIEDDLEEKHSMVIMMPEDRDDKFYDENGQIKNIYEFIDGKYYTVEKGEVSTDTDYKPKIRMANLRNFEEEKLSRQIIKQIESEDQEFYSTLPDFSRIYRATMYNYATISGTDITRDLFSNNLIDHRYLFPENARAVKRIFGIESAQFYLTWKYMTVGFMEKLNPAAVLLLVRFQTYRGVLIPIRSTDIYKRGNSVLAQGSFEKQSAIFKNAAVFGMEDDTTSVGSRIMTGKPCLNGTGSVQVKFDPFYLNNKDNMYFPNQEDIKEEKLHTDDILGSCMNPGDYILPKENIDAESVDNPMLLSDRNKKPAVCLKDDIPSPPKSKAPESLRKISSRKTILSKSHKIDINDLEDIPDAPDYFEEDLLD